MENSMPSADPVIVTQARMSSSRLPKKVLLPLGTKSVLEQHLARLKQTGYPVCLAIADESGSDEIVSIAQRCRVAYVTGPVEDVLGRYQKATKQTGAETIVRVTSDCPLISPGVIRQAVDLFMTARTKTSAYASNTQVRSFPLGFDCEVFSSELLAKANDQARLPAEREHVTPWLYSGKDPRIHLLNLLAPDTNDADLRLTLDTADDYKMFTELFKEPDLLFFNDHQLIQYLRDHPEIRAINAHVAQKKVST